MLSYFLSRYGGREVAASPATGLKKTHIDEQNAVLQSALEL